MMSGMSVIASSVHEDDEEETTWTSSYHLNTSDVVDFKSSAVGTLVHCCTWLSVGMIWDDDQDKELMIDIKII